MAGCNLPKLQNIRWAGADVAGRKLDCPCGVDSFPGNKCFSLDCCYNSQAISLHAICKDTSQFPSELYLLYDGITFKCGCYVFKALSECQVLIIRTLPTKSKEKTFFRDADGRRILRTRTADVEMEHKDENRDQFEDADK
ncbi:hypothetical protein OS493_024117 [Desmophyllum pertusum]|uniref:Uncharacterized protein n=1 Tax=Desmophyllum pertusum TaxID=174260 RepID=A0A9W9ZAU7_9CNID|nr:hypothetical protein OS493_024117 [Desmophyllum pertusum]